MQSRTCTLTAATLSAAMLFGTPATAGELPKEGTWSVTTSGVGTAKGVTVGKERTMAAFDENDLQVGEGLADHMTLHCWGLFDITNGMAQHHGYCVATDPTGDQTSSDFSSDGRYPPDSKSVKGTYTLTGGTGKYAGISGGGEYVSDAATFRSGTEGTYFTHSTNRGHYKLP